MNGLTVVEYVREDGSNPYRAWFDRLHSQAAAKVATAVIRLELGNISGVKWIGTIGEYRIDWGPGYRIYLGKDGEALIVLLDRAKALWAEYRARKAAMAGRAERR